MTPKPQPVRRSAPQDVNPALEYVPCNLCGADDYAIVYPAVPIKETDEIDLSTRFAASSDSIASEQVVKCKRCELVYLNPRVKQQLILEGYTKADNSTYVSQGEGRLRTFRRVLRQIRRHLPQQGRLLDVGCAAGYFLRAAREEGREVHGVEPSCWLVNYGNETFGVNIRQGTLRGAKFPSDHFDVVTFWDVLEHLPDPSSELAETARILKSDGVVLINYPDFGSIWARVFGRRWWWILSIHLYYFTPRTIGRMLQKHGLEPIHRRLHFQDLSLGYLTSRLEPYSPRVAGIVRSVVRSLRLSAVNVRYYASQTTVLARKTLR